GNPRNEEPHVVVLDVGSAAGPVRQVKGRCGDRTDCRHRNRRGVRMTTTEEQEETERRGDEPGSCAQNGRVRFLDATAVRGGGEEHFFEGARRLAEMKLVQRIAAVSLVQMVVI